jgi:hypothetical protein
MRHPRLHVHLIADAVALALLGARDHLLKHRQRLVRGAVAPLGLDAVHALVAHLSLLLCGIVLF